MALRTDTVLKDSIRAVYNPTVIVIDTRSLAKILNILSANARKLHISWASTAFFNNSVEFYINLQLKYS